jgi:hypothetical protein
MGEDIKFEVEVLTRLSTIEQKIDDYKEIKDISREAYNASKNNSKRITEIEDKNKWLGRAVIGAVICELVGLGFMFFQAGIGG